MKSSITLYQIPIEKKGGRQSALRRASHRQCLTALLLLCLIMSSRLYCAKYFHLCNQQKIRNCGERSANGLRVWKRLLCLCTGVHLFIGMCVMSDAFLCSKFGNVGLEILQHQEEMQNWSEEQMRCRGDTLSGRYFTRKECDADSECLHSVCSFFNRYTKTPAEAVLYKAISLHLVLIYSLCKIFTFFQRKSKTDFWLKTAFIKVSQYFIAALPKGVLGRNLSCRSFWRDVKTPMLGKLIDYLWHT